MCDYREYSPDIRLTPWVKNYWSASGFASSEVTPKVFPDGCAYIIFKFDRTAGTSYAYLLGMRTAFIEADYPKSTQLFGVGFKPAGITAFTRVSLEELTDRRVELALVETLFDKLFYETLPEKQSIAEIVAHTNSCLLKRFSCLYPVESQITRAVDLISLSKGQLSLADVASDVCLCQRHFERKFKSVIGVSPKMLAKIVRFNNALQCMQKHQHADLLTIAVECGYYDRTHLAKDFKLLTGETPTDFRKKSNFYVYGEDNSCNFADY
jgi:AraC-like DNA-binding protein